jgi:Vps52 / Sac2 family
MSIINEENKKILHKNKIMVLDFYFDKLNMIIWPRFTQLTDIMNDNIKNALIKNFKLYNQTTVHQSTIKFSQYLQSMKQLKQYIS